MKMVILDAYTSNPGDLSWENFKKLGELYVYDRTSYDEILERCKDADIILDNKVVLDDEIISQLPKLKYIGILATGYNIVDIESAKRHGVTVCNVPTYSTSAVAQLTFALILEFYNRVAVHNKAVHDGEWASCKDFCFQKTPLIEHTEFKYEIIPAVTWCDDCKTTYPTVKYGQTCPNCGSGHTWLQQGQEMNIKEIVAC